MKTGRSNGQCKGSEAGRGCVRPVRTGGCRVGSRQSQAHHRGKVLFSETSREQLLKGSREGSDKI